MKSNQEKETFFIVYDAFIRNLHLYGLELLVYSLLHSFCTRGSGCYNGSISYLARRTNGSRNGVIKALKALIGKGLIEKEPPLRKGRGSAVYTLSAQGEPISFVGSDSTQCDSTSKLSGNNNKVNNKYKDHLDMSRSELLAIDDVDERTRCVKKFAYIFEEDDIDQLSPAYLKVVDLLSEMIAEPAALYRGEKVQAEDVWKAFVFNLREDEFSVSIRDFIETFAQRIEQMNTKDIRNIDSYMKAVLWSQLKEGCFTDL